MSRTTQRASLSAAAILIEAISIAAFCLSCAGCAGLATSYREAPTLLPGVEPAMNSAGFWVSLHPAPDRPILSPDDIARFNADAREKKLVRDLSAYEPESADELKKSVEDTLKWIASLRLYDADGHRAGNRFLEPLRRNMDMGAAGEAETSGAATFPKWAFTVGQADLRVLPTEEGLFDAPGDPYVDNIQASSLDPGTPLILLHASKDGEWRYAVTELATGWIRVGAIAETDRDRFLSRYSNPNTLTATGARAEIFHDREMTQFAGYARMGTPLVAADASDGEGKAIRIIVAERDAEGRLREREAWVAAEDAVRGILPFTARSVYRQAFRLLNAPYGWGGMFGEQDCSQFLCEIFATVGIQLPRNSSKQAKAGVPIPGFSYDAPTDAKTALLSAFGIPGATLLRLPGHIMLYLGDYGGKPYAIHATLGYREKAGMQEKTRLVNRVTVSTLDLGKGSAKKSHLERLTTARTITPPSAAGNAP